MKGVQLMNGKLSQKIQILKFVAEQGVVTVQDVKQWLGHSKHSDVARVTMNRLGLAFMPYGLIKHGIRYIQDEALLELLKTYDFDLPHLEPTKINISQVPHSLGLNQIRILLHKSKKLNVSKWVSENYLKASTLTKRDGLHLNKIPDAIFWHKTKEGKEKKYFLEYERSLKNKKRYVDILTYYAQRDDVSNRNVIYICGNKKIEQELLRIEKELIKIGKIPQKDRVFQFIPFEEFYASYSNSKSNPKRMEEHYAYA